MNIKILTSIVLMALSSGITAKELQQSYKKLKNSKEITLEQIKEQLQLLLDFGVIDIQAQDLEFSEDADVLLDELNERNLLDTPFVERGTMCY